MARGPPEGHASPGRSTAIAPTPDLAGPGERDVPDDQEIEPRRRGARPAAVGLGRQRRLAQLDAPDSERCRRDRSRRGRRCTVKKSQEWGIHVSGGGPTHGSGGNRKARHLVVRAPDAPKMAPSTDRHSV